MSEEFARLPRPSQTLERLGWRAATFLAAFFITCLHLTTTAPFKLTSFERMAHFNAVEPFARRVFVPAIVSGIEHLAPLGNIIAFGAVEILVWIAMLAIAYRALTAFRIGRTEVMRRALAFTILAPMVITLIAPDFYMTPAFVVDSGVINTGPWQAQPLFYYPYDLPAAMFTLALVLLMALQSRRITVGGMGLYLLIFALATVNRETTVFLLPAFVLMFRKRVSAGPLIGLMAAQMALFLAVELPLHWLFSGQPNPNGRIGHTAYELHFLDNLTLLTTPLYLLTWLGRFAGGLYLPVLFWWRFVDAPLRAALLGFVVPLIVFALVVGRIQEHRIFIEAVPLIWLAALQALTERSAVGD